MWPGGRCGSAVGAPGCLPCCLVAVRVPTWRLWKGLGPKPMLISLAALQPRTSGLMEVDTAVGPGWACVLGRERRGLGDHGPGGGRSLPGVGGCTDGRNGVWGS